MCCIDNLFLQQSYFPYYSMNTISSDKHLPVTIDKDLSITLFLYLRIALHSTYDFSFLK